MKRIVTFDIDHLNWGCADIRAARTPFEQLGFRTSEDIIDTDDELMYFTHYYFDVGSAYLGHYPLRRDGNMWTEAHGTKIPSWFEPKGQTGVYSFVISTSDVERSRSALLSAGYAVSPTLGPAERGDAYPNYGGATHSTIFFITLGALPFNRNTMFGCMEHVHEDGAHFDRSGVRAKHDNGVTGLSSATLYYPTAREVNLSADSFVRMYDLLGPSTETVCATRRLVIVDREGYEGEFGVEAPEQLSPVVALSFACGDKAFLAARARQFGLSHSEIDGRLCVDTREAMNAFLVFN